MVEMFIEQFKEIVHKACVRYGGENGVAASEIQILFSLKDDGSGEDADVVYSLLKGYKKVKDITFNNILNVKFDMRGYSLIVPNFIKSKIIEFSEELNVSPLNLTVMCIVSAEEEVLLWLYNDTDAVKKIELEEL